MKLTKRVFAIFIAGCMTTLSVVPVSSFVPQIVGSMPMTGYAEEVESGDFKYEVNDADQTVTLQKYIGTDTKVVVPAQIDGYPVKEIGSAFWEYTDLQSVVISDGITTIGGGAFRDCTSLTEVTIPESVTSIGWDAFRNTPWLAARKSEDPMVIVNDILIDGTACEGDVIVPENIRSISEGAFHDCQYLYSITIPNGVTYIGEVTFWNCPNLTKITFPDSVTEIGKLAFWECIGLESIVLPDSVTSIEYGAFSGCTHLKNITIPDSATAIDSNAFENTPWLKARQEEDPLVIVNDILVDGTTCTGDVTIPDNVTCIVRSAFKSNKSITGITIPDSVSAIGEDTFWGCSNLSNVTIPESVTTIGHRAFGDCASLTSVVIPDGVTRIEVTTFSGCSKLENVILPDHVTSIGSGAFNECVQLSEIKLPDSVTSIEMEAFAYCTNLKEITIPDGVKKISYHTFGNCYSLTSINIPEGVTSIEYSAFEYTGLENVTIPSSVTTIGWNAFNGTPWLAARQKEDPFVIVNGILIDGTACEGDVIIPDGVEYIIGGAFRGYEGYIPISKVTIPKSVAHIGICFYESSVTEVTFLNSKLEIPEMFTGGTEITTFIGYENSTAQRYAEEYGLEFVSLGKEPEWLCGDVNNDDAFNVADIVRLQKWLLAVPGTHLANWKAADLCEDGKLDVFDLCMMKRTLIQK